MATPQSYIAQPSQSRELPAYVIEPYAGSVVKMISVFDETTRTVVNKEAVQSGGFIVKFPHKGHSLYYKDLDAVRASFIGAGIADFIPMVKEGEDSEIVEEMDRRPRKRSGVTE